MILPIASGASAEVYTVNPEGTGDFATIQAAVDAVVDGDIIELTVGVFPGEGNRDVDYLGKAITIRSQGGNPDDCVIDCEGSANHPHRGVLFESNEGPTAVLEGVTIRGAFPPDGRGGAVRCWESNPTLSNCVFIRNSAHDGAGMLCVSSSPVLVCCTFSLNTATMAGGGVFGAEESAPEFLGCTFSGNTSYIGGGIYI